MAAKERAYRSLSDDAALRAIVEGVECERGERCFSSLVKQLASAFGYQYTFVSELLNDRLRFRTRAVWGRGSIMNNFEIPPTGTRCEPVLNGNSTHHPETLRKIFSTNPLFLSKWGVGSHYGVSLLDSSGVLVGHLPILSEEPMWDGPRGLAIMRIFARARAEIERLTENELRLSEDPPAGLLLSTLDAIITFSFEIAETKVMVRRCIEELPGAYRLKLTLRDRDEFDTQEIA